MPCTAGSKSHEIPVYSRLPISIERGSGCRVWDSDGREYLDLYGGHAVCALGYGHPAVTAAIQAQAATLSFQTNAVGSTIRERAVRALAAAAPAGLDQVFLINSGAEANENALRLAFLHTRRNRITAVKGAFHGRTAAAGAITYGHEKWFGFPRAPFEVDWVEVDDLSGLDSVITDDTAAFIFEPVQGVAGAVDLSPEFAQTAARLCAERGALVIADEVQTGVGRTGYMWGVEPLGVVPDILTAAKGLGNGFPVGAVLASERICEGIGIGMLGTTFGGGPMASASIAAVLESMTSDILSNVLAGEQRIREVAARAGVNRVSGRGFLLGLHVGGPAQPVRTRLLDRGFLTGDAKHSEVVRLLPPLILGAEDIEAFGAALAEVLA